MKKDRKRREKVVRRLEKLEDMNRKGEGITSADFIGALYPKFLLEMSEGKLSQETCAELLREVKTLVDVKDYISCPRSWEKKAIHIGDIVYEVGGDGEPLTVEEIFIDHYGSMIECKSLSGKWVSYRPQRLMFYNTKEIFEQIKVEVEKAEHARNVLCEEIKKGNFSLEDYLFPF
ncbi:hypothetical protein [Lancefieldella parvula]|uniref:hypothetical protein n=1 Tax=Lancefieldella parvula TaxID=1382 RepID=UPI00288948E4|nr:hypothetical protein [Lancefieldella parvula]